MNTSIPLYSIPTTLQRLERLVAYLDALEHFEDQSPASLTAVRALQDVTSVLANTFEYELAVNAAQAPKLIQNLNEILARVYQHATSLRMAQFRRLPYAMVLALETIASEHSRELQIALVPHLGDVENYSTIPLGQKIVSYLRRITHDAEALFDYRIMDIHIIAFPDVACDSILEQGLFAHELGHVLTNHMYSAEYGIAHSELSEETQSPGRSLGKASLHEVCMWLVKKLCPDPQDTDRRAELLRVIDGYAREILADHIGIRLWGLAAFLASFHYLVFSRYGVPRDWNKGYPSLEYRLTALKYALDHWLPPCVHWRYAALVDESLKHLNDQILMENANQFRSKSDGGVRGVCTIPEEIGRKLDDDEKNVGKVWMQKLWQLSGEIVQSTPPQPDDFARIESLVDLLNQRIPPLRSDNVQVDVSHILAAGWIRRLQLLGKAKGLAKEHVVVADYRRFLNEFEIDDRLVAYAIESLEIHRRWAVLEQEDEYSVW